MNTPPAPFGGSNDYAFSPDGKELAFTAEPLKDTAWSTNTDIWTVPVDGGEPKNLTEDEPGGRRPAAPIRPTASALAYVSQARAGFEADQWVLKVRDRDGGESPTSPRDLDRPVQSFAWARPGEAESFLAIDRRPVADSTTPIVAIRARRPPTATAASSDHRASTAGSSRAG